MTIPLQLSVVRNDAEMRASTARDRGQEDLARLYEFMARELANFMVRVQMIDDLRKVYES